MSRVKEIAKQREWDLYFLKMVELVATKSEDPNTKVGCVIVSSDNRILSTGYNGLARGVKLTSWRTSRNKGEKYHWFEHAERNAVFNAAHEGIALAGSKSYTYGFPCPDCARAFIQSGISEIVMMGDDEVHTEHNERWKDLYARSTIMLIEAGVKMRKVYRHDTV
jgi:dCMP deaminase